MWHTWWVGEIYTLFQLQILDRPLWKVKHVRKHWIKLANSMTVIMVMNISLTTNMKVQHLPSTVDSYSTSQDTCFYGTRMLTNHIHKQSKWIHFSIHLPVFRVLPSIHIFNKNVEGNIKCDIWRKISLTYTNNLVLWTWRQQVTLKCSCPPTKLHSIVPQNTTTFKQQIADVHKVKCDIICVCVCVYTGLFISPWHILKIRNIQTTQWIMVVITPIKRHSPRFFLQISQMLNVSTFGNTADIYAIVHLGPHVSAYHGQPEPQQRWYSCEDPGY
jgi:hypothetical protein